MNRTLVIWIPGTAISFNMAYQRTRRGMALTPKAREWREYVQQTVTYEAIAAHFPICEQLQAATITLQFHKAQGDADNLVKLCQDAIADGLGVNDKIFSLGGVTREWAGNDDRAGVWVTIEATDVAAATDGHGNGHGKKKGAA